MMHKTKIEPIQEKLRTVAPSVCFTVSREVDPHFVWDGDGPEPDGMDACDVTVAARVIVGGLEVEGCDYLGGCYFEPGEPCGDVQGFLPQMLDEAAEELERQLGERGLLSAELATQLHDAVATIQCEMRARYEAQHGETAPEGFRCNQCEAAMIQGMFCHETGCPNTHKRFVDGEWVKVRECRECGNEVEEGEECCP